MRPFIHYAWGAALVIGLAAIISSPSFASEGGFVPTKGQKAADVDAIKALVGKRATIHEVRTGESHYFVTSNDLISFGTSRYQVSVWKKHEDHWYVCFTHEFRNVGNPKFKFNKDKSTFQFFGDVNNDLQGKEVMSIHVFVLD